MLAVQLIFRWLHILSAVMLVGGVAFDRLVYLPVISKRTDEATREFAAAVRSRWMKLVMLSSGFLLVSGFVNFFLIVANYSLADTFPASTYHGVFGVKFLLALAVFFISSRLAGRSAAAERFRERETTWSSLNLLLAIIIVCLAGLMKFSERSPKTAQPALDAAAITVDGSYASDPELVRAH